MEVDDALQPHSKILSALHSGGADLDDNAIPALALVRKNKRARYEALRRGLVCVFGGLSVEDISRINNWIYRKLPSADRNIQTWMGGVVVAHAATLLIASRHRVCIEAETGFPQDSTAPDKEKYLVLRAWEIQNSSIARPMVDVDRECISILEERMFEESAAAGKAGMWQWGLDAGDHQERWNPYAGLPPHWVHEDRPISTDDSEYEVFTAAIYVDLSMLTKRLGWALIHHGAGVPAWDDYRAAQKTAQTPARISIGPIYSEKAPTIFVTSNFLVRSLGENKTVHPVYQIVLTGAARHFQVFSVLAKVTRNTQADTVSVLFRRCWLPRADHCSVAASTCWTLRREVPNR